MKIYLQNSLKIKLAIFSLITGAISVFITHFIAYFLIQILPNPALISLGIYGSNPHALKGFSAETALRSYPEVLLGIFKGDFGKTLDNTSVSQEIWNAIIFTGPRVFIVLILLVLIVISVSYVTTKDEPRFHSLADFFAFLPAFVIPLVIFSILLPLGLLSRLQSTFLSEIFCILAIAITPIALVVSQTRATTIVNIKSMHAKRHLSAGASIFDMRTRLLRNLFIEISPTFEKIITTMLAYIIFAEPIFSLPGLGTTVVRAVRRSDLNLLLAAIFIYAIVINSARILSNITRELLKGKL